MTESPYSVQPLGKSWQKIRHHPRTSAIRELAEIAFRSIFPNGQLNAPIGPAPLPSSKFEVEP